MGIALGFYVVAKWVEEAARQQQSRDDRLRAEGMQAKPWVPSNGLNW